MTAKFAKLWHCSTTVDMNSFKKQLCTFETFIFIQITDSKHLVHLVEFDLCEWHWWCHKFSTLNGIYLARCLVHVARWYHQRGFPLMVTQLAGNFLAGDSPDWGPPLWFTFSETHGLHVKCLLLLLSHFNQNWNAWINFIKTFMEICSAILELFHAYRWVVYVLLRSQTCLQKVGVRECLKNELFGNIGF